MQPTDWHDLNLASAAPAVVDPRRRLRFCMGAFAALLVFIWCRAMQLEVGEGAAFRAEALRPIVREKQLPAPRGRILARDGTVLACDRLVAAVAVDYRWLEEPPRQSWLEQEARNRLPKEQRRKAGRLADEVAKLRRERDDLHKRLAALCGVDFPVWQARERKVQARVERIAADARQRQLEAAQNGPPPPTAATWHERISAALHEIFEPARDAVPAVVTVAEELKRHVLAEDVPAGAVAEIETHPDQFPGTRIVQLTRRSYPRGALAAHLIGYLGVARGRTGADRAASAGLRNDEVGATGIEAECETELHGRPGAARETIDRIGRIEKAECEREAAAGRDVTLTLDIRLQQTAEELLDSALKRVARQYDSQKPSGGAIVVLDVRDGAILALASAPRFDPAAFAGDDSAGRAALLVDPAHPLFHRAIQMALPPGSVFKTLTAAALLESGGVDPAAKFYCRGYLKRPDELRCAVFVQHGTGHGDVTLAEALAESCNVYFFHHVESLPPAALPDWAHRFGFGAPTGIDLPGEARGIVPSPDTMEKLTGHRWHTSDAQAMAVGQGALTATPLQIARMMAAVANGGLLVTPHVIRTPDRANDISSTSASISVDMRPRPIPGLTYSTLAAIRAGLLRTVADKEGTAHNTLYLDQVSIAGKTGTAVIGGNQPEHAWFAGYVPADKPRYALVVVLERAGNASTAACPLAKRLVLKMLETKLLSASVEVK